ncbi:MULTISPECIES: replication initiator protein A [Cyanophyceae]|uniref:Replication initiator protein A n=1 Tax=Leptolyngbya subtilissima DQ-A4 TaxID=2933933 RepID=A0ABV0KCS3_9CYAN|nr:MULTISPECIES: replication initiator protein A [Cyanophyceae]MBD1877128.1 replication initiator protein A [Nodosilinea sp. FACHB-131]MBD1919464.1 replication initiator protein A [Phormidium sp. FACHB-77]MBD2054316.1 replication initiator protein A [Leptolyngbya sp. FACHB-60]MBD2115196.1 replication initiator protein A [Nodosilinea sp. FACHB-141]
MAHRSLLPDRHRQLDFFVCDIIDTAPKDDLGSMEHPLFTLAKNPDTRIRLYEHNGNTVKIVPSVLGLATIFDKDILIYCVSQLTEAINRKRDVSRTVRLTAYDFLVATNRDTGGRSYQLLEQAFQRLTGTKIFTNIVVGGRRFREGFGLIESYRIIEKSPNHARMVAVEVTLSEWLFQAVCSQEVLTLHRDYFRLGKGLERRLYELARKHCGSQPQWKVGLALLHKKSGSSSSLKEFRRMARNICEADHLPGYLLSFDEPSDSVLFQCRSERAQARAAIRQFLDL